MANSQGTKTSSFGVSKRENHDSTEFYRRNLYSKGNCSTNISEKQENIVPVDVIDHLFGKSSSNMSMIPNFSVHLVVTSPPYNVGKEYEKDLSLKSYTRLIRNVLKECYRVLVDGGRLCLNVANIGRKPYIPMHKIVIDIALKIGFQMRGEVIWNKSAGAGSSTAWGSWKSAANPTLRDIHEYILIFSKGSFGRDKNGKIDTITGEEFARFTQSIWSFMPESAKKVNHPAPFPLELPYRCIQLYSFKGDVVLDPFCGVGTTCLAAKLNGRHYIGFDKNKRYIEIAETRLESSFGEQIKMPI